MYQSRHTSSGGASLVGYIALSRVRYASCGHLLDTLLIIASTSGLPRQGISSLSTERFINNVVAVDELFDVEKDTFTSRPKFALASPEFTGP